MKTNFCFTLVLCCFLGACTPKEERPCTHDATLQCRIERAEDGTRTETWQTAAANDGGDKLTFALEYNRRGQKELASLYRPDGTVSSKISFDAPTGYPLFTTFYAPDGHVTAQEENNPATGGFISHTAFYPSGLVKVRTQADPLQGNQLYNIVYNDGGEMVSVRCPEHADELLILPNKGAPMYTYCQQLNSAFIPAQNSWEKAGAPLCDVYPQEKQCKPYLFR